MAYFNTGSDAYGVQVLAGNEVFVRTVVISSYAVQLAVPGLVVHTK
jgi:hypothetical protein